MTSRLLVDKIENELRNTGSKILEKKYTDDFFLFLHEHYTFSHPGFCIDWSGIKSSICIDISDFTYDQMISEILKTSLMNYEYVCFSYNSENETILCQREIGLKHLHHLLLGPGDAYIYGANKSKNDFEFTYESLLEFYAGNWLCYQGNK